MEEFKKIGLMGAGAVGSYVVMGLYDKYGDNFKLIAKGERRERLERDGLVINGRTYRPVVVDPADADIDLLFIALKYGALEGALDDIAAATGEKTVVVSLMNGVDSEDIIASRIGMDHIVHSLIKIASTRNGNNISFPLPGGVSGIYVGETDEEKKAAGQPRAGAIQAVFDGTDVICHVSDDILAAMWDKFAVNIVRNLPQAILGVGCGVYEDSEYIRDLGEKLRLEVLGVAAARGVRMSGIIRYANTVKSQRYSTLQDLDAGRTTEIEMFSGALIRMGREAGVSCPYNEVIYDLIKALEEKNAGKFDYE